MTWTAWNELISAVRDLRVVFGVGGTVTLIVLLIVISMGALLLFGYMVLRFGERGTEMLLPFIREGFLTLRNELAKAHPAIRLELHLQRVFLLILFSCFLATSLHAFIPWMRVGVEHLFFDGFVTSLVIIVILTGVSIGLSLRLK